MNKYFSSTIIILLSFLSFSCNKSTTVRDEQPEFPQQRAAFRLKNSQEGQSIMSSYKGSYALLIGQSDYTNGWSDLLSIPSELKAVKEVLIKQGFTVEMSSNLKSGQLYARFKKFIADYGFKPNNRLLFFYSGHGYSRKNGQKGYLVPTDAANPNIDEPAFLRKALNMDYLVTLAREIEAKHALFLFDSCFSGTVFQAKALPKVPRQLTQATKLPVRQFITAGSADETVPASSTFTPAFVDALKYGWGDLTHDGYVTGQELGLYLQSEVPKHARQTPQFGKIKDYKLSRGDFVFFVGAKPVVNNQQVVQVKQENAEIARLKKENAKLKHQVLIAGTTIPAQPPVVKPTKPTVVIVAPRSKFFRDRLKDGSKGPEMVRIPAGSFRMGSNNGDSDEKPVHKVSLSAFSIGKYEVTFAEYDKFANATGKDKPSDRGWGRGNRPVINVSWHDAVAYAKWLSQQTGHIYRLPTEAEWEYAARAGTSTKYWWGNTASHEYMNYGTDECCSGLVKGKDRWEYTAPVGSFAANPFGIYDTAGNVWEWVSDIYSDSYYKTSPPRNPTGPSTGRYRVRRGGAWSYYAQNARSADRFYHSPGSRLFNVGFRLLRMMP